MVMEQIANLSTGNRCQGSNPCLSAVKPGRMVGLFFVRGMNTAKPVHDLCFCASQTALMRIRFALSLNGDGQILQLHHT